MSNIWKKQRDVGQHPKRNNFDLSFQSHCTFKFGYLYPVFKRLVYPGDSFRLDSAFDLKMMPVEFPVQSRIRAFMYYFYVRNKNVWSGWEDFISGLKSVNDNPPPYVMPTSDKVKNGSIYDFLNIPTSVVGRGVRLVEFPSFTGYRGDYSYSLVFSPDSGLTGVYSSYYKFYPGEGYSRPCIASQRPFQKGYTVPSVFNVSDSIATDLSSIPDLSISSWQFIYFLVERAPVGEGGGYLDEWDFENIGSREGFVNFAFSSGFKSFSFSPSALSLLQDIVDGLTENQGLAFLLLPQPHVYDLSGISTHATQPISISHSVNIDGQFTEYSSAGLHLYDSLLPLSALPFRVYESIYRSYFASDVWQPLVIDGQREYNKFNTTTDGGLDSTDYHLFRRNYELDFLTSALPSPQAGPAPLVGINALGQITVTDENGITTADAVVNDDGKITQVAITSPLASVEHGRTIMNIVNAGMSINDFRNVNALQNFLEQTLRSGYRYMNFVKGHFGVEPKYSELDMPEFIGGYSRDVQMSTVVSQANTLGDSIGSSLGDFAGLGRVVGGSNHSISHYCDDYGWIMGVMCIVPTPAYSQLLPKENLVPTNYLDFYSPEFAQIGMQPITYKEVCPIQSYLDSLVDPSKTLEDTFGYQRPNYDCVGAVDEVHGEFRGTLSQQLINRIFDGRPELGSSFLEIDPAEVNDIFINQNPDDDVFIGHLAFRVLSKRPFPRVHFPSLGH